MSDKNRQLEHEIHELEDKLKHSSRSGGDTAKLTADLHYYKEKYEHAISERDDYHRQITSIEVTVTKKWEAKYHRVMKGNRELKERHRTLKVSYRSTGGHASSSSDSSSSHSD
jgi:cell division septum initiation protein DivIVA